MIQNKKASILLILNVLKEYSDEEHFLTQQDIINKVYELYNIELERKSVAFSISLLEELNYDINKGPHGGYALFNRNINNVEAKFLIDAIFSSKVINAKQAKELTNKLMNNLSIYQRRNYDYLYKTSDINRTNNNEIFLTLETIEEAIKLKKRISFQYIDYDENDNKILRRDGFRYIVSPYYLINNFGRYYLLCNYREKYRALQTFRIEYMTSVNIEPDWNIKPINNLIGLKDKPFNISKYINDHIYMLGGDVIEINVLVEDKKMIRIIKDWFNKNATRVKNKDKDNNDIIYKIKCNEEALIYWVMQYSEFIKVLSPSTFIDKLLNVVNNSFSKYKE